MGRRLLAGWEALAPRHQVLVATPLALLVLFGVHEAFFPLLTWKRSLMYAVMECVPLALVVTFATQVELVRREQRAAGGAQARDDGHDAAAPDAPDAPGSRRS